MRHSKLNKRFGRNRSARLALVRDLARATLLYESITTTERKAKEARKLVEKLISLGKEGSLKSRRMAFAELCDHALVSVLFKDIALRFQKRSGGYTRIYSLLSRRGDGAGQVILELTEKKKKEKVQKTKAEKKEKKPAEALTKESEQEEVAQIKEPEKEVSPVKKATKSEPKKAREEVEAKEKNKPEEKSAPPLKEKSKHKETKPPTKFLGGLRKFFKKERDSL